MTLYRMIKLSNFAMIWLKMRKKFVNNIKGK